MEQIFIEKKNLNLIYFIVYIQKIILKMKNYPNRFAKKKLLQNFNYLFFYHTITV